jgi:hypothetical protein
LVSETASWLDGPAKVLAATLLPTAALGAVSLPPPHPQRTRLASIDAADNFALDIIVNSLSLSVEIRSGTI